MRVGEAECNRGKSLMLKIPNRNKQRTSAVSHYIVGEDCRGQEKEGKGGTEVQ